MLSIGGIFATAQLLKNFTDSQIPYLDAITTVLSWIAQWMICKKIIETWFLWFVVDVIYVGLYFYKGIPAHGILLMIYLGNGHSWIFALAGINAKTGSSGF